MPDQTPEQMLREFHASKAIHGGLMPERPTADIPEWVRDLKAADERAAVAEARAGEAEAEVQVQRDIVTELRRRDETRERMNRRARERLASALGRAGRCTLNLDALVAEAERRLAEQDATIERLKSEALGRVVNPMVRDVLLPEMET